jgi:cytochrome P450
VNTEQPSPARPREQATNGRLPRWTVTGGGEDIADPHFYAGTRHFEVWEQARREHPIAWTESSKAGSFWSVTSHDLGNQILRQPAVFVSGRGMRLGGNPAAIRMASGRTLVVSDGDTHRALRSAHAAWFSGKAMSAMRPGLERTIEDLLRHILTRDAGFDAVADLAVQVPIWVLFEMMGVPSADRERLVQLTATAFDDSGTSPGAAHARATAHTGIFAYFIDLVAERRARPGTDIVTSLVQAKVNGRNLTDEEIILNCDGLLNGGLETTPHAISGALLAFSQYREAWSQLKKDPELIDTAVEEILRWASPPMHAMRTAVAESTVGPARIFPGDPVVVWLASCNRDEDVFPGADRFLIDRRPNPHLCFAAGPHYCIGALLARIELRCFLAALLTQVASVELTGEIVRQRSNFLHGLTRLDVRLTAEPRG